MDEQAQKDILARVRDRHRQQMVAGGHFELDEEQTPIVPMTLQNMAAYINQRHGGAKEWPE